MEILCAVLFALFSYILFLGISEGFFSHLRSPNSTLNSGITSLIIFFNFEIKNCFNYYSLSLLSVKDVSLKYTLKPKSSFYF